METYLTSPQNILNLQGTDGISFLRERFDEKKISTNQYKKLLTVYGNTSYCTQENNEKLNILIEAGQVENIIEIIQS